ncbi:MAG TPA: hypothetical protein VNU49_01940 [Opitutaceae bacterium]|nr:hypothetical protein [Opitutaceae bacterium]
MKKGILIVILGLLAGFILLAYTQKWFVPEEPPTSVFEKELAQAFGCKEIVPHTDEQFNPNPSYYVTNKYRKEVDGEKWWFYDCDLYLGNFEANGVPIKNKGFIAFTKRGSEWYASAHW